MEKKRLRGTLTPRPDELIRLRRDNGWSQGGAARLLGISLRTYQRLEKGRRAYPATIRAISDLYKVPMQALVREKIAPNAVAQLEWQSSIDKNYNCIWTRIEKTKPRRVWTTYLNPGAFRLGLPPKRLRAYYQSAEQWDIHDYRRVFGIYPALREFRDTRDASLRWISDHLGRTSHLQGYRVRYVELTFLAAEMLLDDTGVNFAFPSDDVVEVGWSTTDKKIMNYMKEYFQKVWDSAFPIEKLISGVDRMSVAGEGI
jgi:transcriptional regulator with XRE-family HTH domain